MIAPSLVRLFQAIALPPKAALALRGAAFMSRFMLREAAAPLWKSLEIKENHCNTMQHDIRGFGGRFYV